jgi:hypothetical protein
MNPDAPPESGDERDEQPDDQRRDSRARAVTFTYDSGQSLTTARHDHEPIAGSVPALPEFEWEHLAEKRLFALRAAGGKTEYWRDNPTRYLVVEIDEKTGGVKPALKHRQPVYLWLCREERAGR